MCRVYFSYPQPTAVFTKWCGRRNVVLFEQKYPQSSLTAGSAAQPDDWISKSNFGEQIQNPDMLDPTFRIRKYLVGLW